MKRLAKVEQSIQDRLKREARCYNKSYPGEMVHVDTKRLPHKQHVFKEAPHRQVELVRFINFYNTAKPHKSLNIQTPYEILVAYFNQPLITS